MSAPGQGPRRPTSWLTRCARWGAAVCLAAAALAATLLTGAGLSPSVQAQTAADAVAPRAVFFSYSRFGDDAYPANSIALDQFEAHLDELEAGGYTVLPPSEIAAALAEGKLLPERTVGLTIDIAHGSIWREAYPRLKAMGLPFAIFIATDTVDRGQGDVLSWDQIREMARNGAEIGSLTASHPRMLDQDRAYNIGQIRRSIDRIEQETGKKPLLFAYPYGEYSAEIRELARQAGFIAAFGQQAGVAQPRDLFQLPRFAMHDPYGGVDRFRMAAAALPLTVSDLTPEEMILDANPPTNVGFTVDAIAGDLAGLSCFVSGVGRVRLETPGGRRVEARFDDPLPPGRIRFNCAMPSDDGRWRWFGRMLLTPR